MYRMINTFNLIEKAKNLFEIKKDGDFYIGLLCPPKDNSIYPYNAGILSFFATVKKSGDKFEFFSCIRSIDDSGLSIFGPPEEEVKAKYRLEKFLAFINSYQKTCPNKEDMEFFCKELGAFPNYW